MDHIRQIDLWMPRLQEASEAVRKNAGHRLAKIAAEHPDSRDRVLPELLKAALEEREDFDITFSSILDWTEDIPKTDLKWLSPFLEVYIELASYGTYYERWALRYVEKLIDEEVLSRSHPAASTLGKLAQDGLERNDNSDSRASMHVIADWYANDA